MKKPALACIVMLLILVICPGKATAQFENRNSINLELAGHGGLYSINYERVLINHERFKTVVDAGLSLYPESTGMSLSWIPTVISELISFDEHHIEIGLGHIFTVDNPPIKDPLGDPLPFYQDGNFFTGRLAYRYQKEDSRLILKLAFTPILEYGFYSKDGSTFDSKKTISFSEFHHYAGVSIGYAF